MPHPSALREQLGPVSPTSLGSFVKVQRCEQYLAWELLADDIMGEDARFDESLLSPLYAETGTQFESQQLRALISQRRVDEVVGSQHDRVEGVDFDYTWGESVDTDSGDEEGYAWESGLTELVDIIETAHAKTGDFTVVAFQPPLSDRLGAWDIAGLADIVVVRPPRTGDQNETGDLTVDILEVKSSADEQTHHRIQAACYSRLLRETLSERSSDLVDRTTFTGRVVTRSNAITDLGYGGLESFSLEPTETDIEMLLRAGGRLDRTLFDLQNEEITDTETVEPVDPKTVTNRMSKRCAGCSYHDVCYTHAVEQDGLELLGIPEGTQDELNELGVETLEDLANLFDRDRFIKPTKRVSEQVRPRDDAPVETIRNEVELKDLERFAIAADVFSTEGDANERPGFTSYIPDSGYNLPSGEPEQSLLPDFLTSYPNRSLIRVYLYVQEDSIRERLDLLGGYVINYRTGEARHVSALTPELPRTDIEDGADNRKLDSAEQELIRNFLTGDDGLLDKIQEVAPRDIDDEYHDGLSFPGFVHLYFYSPGQRDALMRTTKRHIGTGDGEFEALRTLLGLRTDIDQRDIDQEMVSVLQEEFVMRHLLRFSGFGLIQTVEQFRLQDPDNENLPEDVTYRTQGELDYSWNHDIEGEPTKIPLQHIFDEHLFENVVKYNNAGGRVRFDLDDGVDLTPVGSQYYNTFPFASRYTDTLPLEYIWGAFDELTPDWVDPESVDDPEKATQLRELIYRYRHVNGKGTRRIEPRHLRALAESMAEAIEHIEASIIEWNKSDGVPKSALPLDQLLELSFDEMELELTAREYLDLEHGAKERQLRRDWRQSIPYRLTGGKSVMFRCTKPPVPDDETNSIQGKLWTPDGVELDAAVSESSVSEGDWVLMTPVKTDGDQVEEIGISQASDIQRMPLVHVSEVDGNTITVDAPWNDWDHWPQSYHNFLHGHHRYENRSEVTPSTDRYIKNDDEENVVVIDEDAAFILDPAHDDVVSYHCSRALDRSDNNHVLHWLNDLLTGDRTEMETPFCNGDLIEGAPSDADIGDFIATEFVEADSIDEEPNEPQRRFIREDDRHLVVVQGPPGTGKTSYTTSPAVLGRAYAFEKENRDFAAAVSALSHDAVDELFTEVRAVAADRQRDELFNQMKLIRVRPSGLPDEAESYDDRDDDQLVEHIAYHDSKGEKRLRELAEEYLLNGSEDPSHFILFGPPTSLRGAVDKIARLIIDVEDLDREGDHPPSAWELLEEGESDLFDLGVVDEASMMDLPLLFLAGAFLKEDGQMLLAGDHRQMQPIQSFGWDEEDRETIEETVPFLSGLDYIRYLKGDIEDIDYIERDSPQLDAEYGTDEQEQATLPMYPLEQSFRLPQPVANLLTELFYQHDGIELGGVEDRATIPDIRAGIEADAVRALVDPNEWVSVLIHSGELDERSSEIEAAVAESILDGFEVVSPENEDLEAEEISAGVVVPFTAQRDRLQSELDEDVQAQTVEKFQGGERDMILMSMVASDPGYVNQLSEFILSPYRFNVAASRMKRKLVIIASQSVFQTSHPDADQYDDQIAWKRLYKLTGALDDDTEPAEEGSVQEIDPDIDEDASYEVYHAGLDRLEFNHS